MTSDDDRYSCWFPAVFQALITLVLVLVALGGAIAVLQDPSAGSLLGLAAVVAGVTLACVATWWWVGCEVRVEGEHIAWRSILRRRWIPLDRVSTVTAPTWTRRTFAIETDDGRRLRTLVSSGYRASARRFADRVDERSARASS